MRVNKDKIKDYGSTSIGIAVLGFLSLAGISEDQVMNLWFAVADIVNSFSFENITVGSALAFFFYNFGRKGSEE
jgi:hypothetical protein